MATAKLSFLPLGDDRLTQDDLAVVQLFDTKSSWVWTAETGQARGPPDAPGGEQRGFRKTFDANASGQSPSAATVVIAVDNYFAMYINGALLQQADPQHEWSQALAFRVPLNGNKTVLAIRAINLPSDQDGLSSAAGLRAAIGLSFPNGATQTFYTGLDRTFLGEKLIPEGWEQPDFDDKAWQPATIYPDSVKTVPWGALQLPTNILVGTSVPTIPPSATATVAITTTTVITSGEHAAASGTTSGDVFFGAGEFAGLIIGIIAFVSVVVGLVTFGLMRRRYRKVSTPLVNPYFRESGASHFISDTSSRTT